jgi:hypothetical protein
MPPNDTEVPAPEETGTHETTRPDQDLKSGLTLGHGSPFCRWRHFDKHRRRREHAELKRLCDAITHFTPSTFGLEPDELRRHANTLVLEHDWTVAEVCAVLDIEPARAS